MTKEEQLFAYKELRNNGQSFFVDTYEDADRIIDALEDKGYQQGWTDALEELEEWIIEVFPDWCEGDVRSILNRMDMMKEKRDE